MATQLQKAITTLSRRMQPRSISSLSGYVPGMYHTYGQPLPAQASVDAQGLVTPLRMRELVMKTPTAAACVNAILDYACHIDITIQSTDPSKKPSDRKQQYLQDFLDDPNIDNTGLEFKQKLFRDITIVGMGAVEIEDDVDGNPAALHVLDMATLKIDFDEHGSILGYIQFNVHGQKIVRHEGDDYTLYPNEVIFFRRDPQSSTQYSMSRLNQLYVCAIIESLMLAFIGGRFTESNVPFGVMDLGDITPDELKRAINQWNDQADSGHKVMITGSKGTSHWYPFGYHLKDLEATQLLAEVRGKIMAIMGVTMNELGESQDVSKSNGYNLSYTFKKRGVEPLLKCFTTTTSKYLLRNRMGFRDVILSFDEIDSRDELLQAEIDKTYWAIAVRTTNEIRNEKGLASVEGGDEALVMLGTNAVPLRLVAALSEVQLMALMGVVDSEGNGAQTTTSKTKNTATVSPPIIRPPSLPMSFKGAGSQGSISPKIMYPRPQSGHSDSRGTVATLRTAGVRTENIKGTSNANYQSH